jgi:hypothetical protein
MAMTLAMLVAMMTASSVKKLPKVIWPIESENDRIRFKITATIDDMAQITGFQKPTIYDVIPRRGNLPQRGETASFERGNGGFPAAATAAAKGFNRP